ncbi:MAG TPA: hypothetical protein VMW87_09250 [Spirochaetia bacterium]|nr:hypothetical protein [Spirochaetia bacterium]
MLKSTGVVRGRRRSRASRSAVVAVLLIILIPLVAGTAAARGGFRGGGFRSSSLFRSFGAGRATPGGGSLFGWGSATRRAGTAAAPLRSGQTVSGSRAAVAAQRNLYATARRNGTLFSTRNEAVQAFAAKNAGRYSSRFSSDPAARPAYIPRSTVVDGRTVNVAYNAGLGGYGYIDPFLGHWVMYNALTDAAMMGVLMSNQGYYWGAPPLYVSHGPGFFTWAIILFVGFMLVSSLMRTMQGGRRR